MKKVIAAGISIGLAVGAFMLYDVSQSSKSYPNELIRIDSAVIVEGSIWTNNTWVSVGKVSLPKDYVAGPFQVQ